MGIKRSLVIASNQRMVIASAGNTWREVHSATRKRRKLNGRLHGGIRSLFKSLGRGTNKRCSFLTLTVDPQDQTPQQCYERMTKAWNALATWWRKSYPSMKFFRVVELHSSGFPHFHVLLICAPYIQQKSIVSQWKNLLGQARAIVDIRAVRNPEHAVRYVTKYLLKQSEVITKLENEAKEAFKTQVEHSLEWQAAANEARKLGLEDDARRCEAEARRIGGEGDEVRIAALICELKKAQDEGNIDSVTYFEDRLERVKEEIREARAEKNAEANPENKNIADASWWGRRVRPWSASRGLLEQEQAKGEAWWDNVSVVPFITPTQAAMVAASLGFETEKFDPDIGFYDFRANAPSSIQA
jgi:hypothetical protein